MNPEKTWRKMYLQGADPSTQQATPCCDRMVADPGECCRRSMCSNSPPILHDGCRLHALCYALVSPLANEGLFFPEAIPGLRLCWVKHP